MVSKKTDKKDELRAEEQDGGAKKRRKTSGSKKGKSKKMTTKSSKKSSKKGGKKGSKSKKNRFFKAVNEKSGQGRGRYTGDTPKQAASKSYTKYIQRLKAKGKGVPKSTTIYLRESTRGSNRKVYGYVASRVKLAEPQELTIKDNTTGEKKTITYNYRNQIHKVAVPEQLGGAKKKKPSKSKSKSGKAKPAKKSGSKTAKKSKGKKGGKKAKGKKGK
jgi:hypothetical protein